ncbi:MAG: hypothetical protein ABJG68_13615 [Crocinitomicaceae bacterium]
MNRLLICALLSVSLISCKKLNKLTQFEIEYSNTAIIPSSTGINLPFVFVTPEKETNSETTFEINDTRKDKIQQIMLTDLELDVTSPNSEDFSFLKSIKIYLNADGLDEILLAWKDPVPESTSTILILECTNADMQEYIKKDQFTLRVNAVTDEIISQDHELSIFSKYFVDAKIVN